MAPILLTLFTLLLLAPSQALVYDYVIIGGGTCGLVIANRLSELANITVAVIEAGASAQNNPNVTSVSGYTKAFGTAIDWAYETTNQAYSNGKKQVMRAGKAIGGTSTINGMAYTRTEDAQINSWQGLGISGWDWTTLFPYYLKSERFEVPDAAQVATGITYYSADHGSSGPLTTGYTNGFINGTIGDTFNQTYSSIGINWNHDVNGGRMCGLAEHPKTVDQAANVREDAGRAYYYPIASRPNLILFQNTTANHLLWNSTTNGNAIAGGVQVSNAKGVLSTIYARKEVIVSAGSLRSPLILELSGVGNPTILNKYAIPVVVNLTTVGENLQDQNNNAYFFGNKATLNGSTGFVAYLTAADLYGPNVTSFAASVSSSLNSYATTVASATNNAVTATNLQKLFQMQYQLIFNSTATLVEVLTSIYGSTFDIEYWTLLPFTRGNIHISSSTPTALATINPNYFLLDFDLNVQVAASKFIRNTIMTTQPLASQVSHESLPGTKALPSNANDSAFAKYLKGAYRSNWHPVGTAAMMSRELGGVVDSTLKVYGTNNVRVVDASVLPFQLTGHLSSTLYAVAERAADLIKADM